MQEENPESVINLFLDNFKEKDLYTQVILEMIFEQIIKNEKK